MASTVIGFLVKGASIGFDGGNICENRNNLSITKIANSAIILLRHFRVLSGGAVGGESLVKRFSNLDFEMWFLIAMLGVVAGLCMLAYGFRLLFVAGRRKRGVGLMVSAPVVFFVVAGLAMNQDARANGWAGMSERGEAAALGITDAAAFEPIRQQRLQEAQRIAAEVAAAEQKRLAEERAKAVAVAEAERQERLAQEAVQRAAAAVAAAEQAVAAEQAAAAEKAAAAERAAAEQAAAEEKAEQVRADRLRGAYIRCESATEGRVADPDGIRFAGYSDWTAEWGEGQNSVTFTFEMVARNAFGGLVPVMMECSATYDGQRWTAGEIRQKL